MIILNINIWTKIKLKMIKKCEKSNHIYSKMIDNILKYHYIKY
jgi:hypothetical protein